MNENQIPNTDSIRELAKFWDTHDVTDFEDSLEEVTEPVFKRKDAITLNLQPEDAIAVHKLATSMGVDDAALIQQWVLEKIQAH